ncbi:MAG TPA: hypothetical protein VI322_03080 [Candidatus Saccharimonadia bacterium]
MTPEFPTSNQSLVLQASDEPAALAAVTAAARVRNCRGQDPEQHCASCRRFASGNQTAIRVLTPEDKASLGIEPVRVELRQLTMAVPRQHDVRYLVITPAHLLTPPAQNALLKTLEEPPAQTVIVLITPHPEQLLETVRSRCRLLVLGHATASDSTAAEAFRRATPFERLLLAKQLVDTKTDLAAFGRELHRLCLMDAATTPAAALRQSMAALEQFRRHQAAGVSARAALEVLGVQF